MENKTYCPYIEICNSRPVEIEKCMFPYENCLTYKLMKEQEEETLATDSGLIRFLKKKQKARERGFNWKI